MSKSFHIVGDGLAGLLLARRLHDEGWQVQVHGDGRSNTPPVALVHLFAGRSFRRSNLELAAFQAAVEFWRAEPLAREHIVRRRAEPGDRLDKSASFHDVPRPWAPRRREDGWFEYQPGFSIAAQQLEKGLRSSLEPRLRPGRVDPSSLSGPKILALGSSAPEYLPDVAWNVSAGRTLEAFPERQPDGIIIGGGVHIAPSPSASGVSLGGRTSAVDGPLEDELARAQQLLGQSYRPGAVWRGARCALAADRLPVLGWLDPQTLAFLGFGSRALFWLPYCLDLTVATLRDGQNPPDLLSCRRL